MSATQLLVTADEGRAARRARTRRRWTGKEIVFHVVVLALLVVILYPVAWMLLSTFKPSSQIVGNAQLLPREVTFENYETALSGIGGVSFWTFFQNSTILAVLSVIGVVISSALAAYAFARIDFPGRSVYFGIMIATLLLPFHVVIIPQYIMFNALGMVNTFTPLLLGKFLATEAFFVFLMVQFIRGLPRELDEAARIDGCGHPRIFLRIILPLMVPALATTTIFTFIWTWNDFFSQLIYLTDPHMYTVPVALRGFVDSTSSSSWGSMFAMSVVSLVPVFLAFLLGQRFLIKGIATTGIK